MLNPMMACPRYAKCSASICPLDPDWEARFHLPGERVCRWLTELAKPGGEGRIRAALVEVTADQIVQVAPLVYESMGAPLRHRIDEAAKTGSMLEKERQVARNFYSSKSSV